MMKFFLNTWELGDTLTVSESGELKLKNERLREENVDIPTIKQNILNLKREFKEEKRRRQLDRLLQNRNEWDRYEQENLPSISNYPIRLIKLLCTGDGCWWGRTADEAESDRKDIRDNGWGVMERYYRAIMTTTNVSNKRITTTAFDSVYGIRKSASQHSLVSDPSQFYLKG